MGRNQYEFDGAVDGVTVPALIKRQTENYFSFEFKILGSNIAATAGSLGVTTHAGMNGGSTSAMVHTE
jgi:hypothetical protein